ncbi:MAG: hypothetical protein LIO77_08495 [Rikenellaceae bacterium]|nr:hypothetical protein [Rikenellaceae bacterium]
MKNILLFLLTAVTIIALVRGCGHKRITTVRHIDTLILRDTVRDTLLVPHKVYLSRTDTVYLPSPADTVFMEVVVPVERKEYRTENYFAVVEGYRPRLVAMSVFPETRYITETTTTTVTVKPRLGIGIHTGYGYGKQGLSPYVGVGLHYNILTF